MARKIISAVLIVLGSLFLVLSVAGILAVWIYNGPLTRETTRRLNELDSELAQAQTTLANSQTELERALRILNATEAALNKLTQQNTSAENILDNIQITLDQNLLPELKTTREQIGSARTTLENLQNVLEGVAKFVPGVDLNIPKNIMANLISSATSMDTEISNLEALATQASTFVSDTSVLLGGDFTETRKSLENFLTAIKDYETKVTDWRAQVADLKEGAPKWIDEASVALTIFLLWFGFSQFGLVLHGLAMRRGIDPLAVLRREQIKEEEEVSI